MNTFNVIAIDPGNNTGITIYTIEDINLSIVNIETTVVVLNSRVENNINDKIFYLNNYFKNLLKEYNPLVVVSEAAFLNSRFPKAVMQLSQYIAALDLAVSDYPYSIKTYRYPPKLIKSKIGASGNADKDMMLTTVSKIKEIKKFIDFDKITEHEVDSLAIGYVYLNELREYPDMLIR